MHKKKNKIYAVEVAGSLGKKGKLPKALLGNNWIQLSYKPNLNKANLF